MIGRNVNQLMDLETEEPTQLWGPAVCTHNLVMIYGGTGIGKSHFAWKMLHTIASGGRFLNHVVRQPSKALLIEGELGLSATKKRLAMIQADAPYSPRGDYLRILSKDDCGGRLWNISDPKHQKHYNAVIGDANVILIDNLLSSVFPVDKFDDDVKQWERIIPWLFMIRDSGRTVILIHHTGKSGTQLGTSIKENWLDTNIQLKLPDNPLPIRGTEFELHYRKTRDVKRCDALPLHVEYVEGGDGVSRWNWSPLEDSQKQTIQQMKAEGLTRREVAKQLGISYREVNAAWGEFV